MPNFADYDASVIRRTLSEYTNRSIIENRSLANTGILTTATNIISDGEDYYGTMRYELEPSELNYGSEVAGMINIDYPDESDTEVVKTDFDSQSEIFIKTYRSAAAEGYGMTNQLILDTFGAVEKAGQRFGRWIAKDQDNTILQMLLSATKSEVLGTGFAARTGDNRFGQSIDDPRSDDRGFYVDISRNPGSQNVAAGALSLVDTAVGANPLSRITTALAAALGDNYEAARGSTLIVSTETADLLRRSAIADAETIVTGNPNVFSIGRGMINVYESMFMNGISFAGLGTQDANQPVHVGSTTTSFLVLEGAIDITPIPWIGESVAMQVEPLLGRGAGKYAIVSRWAKRNHILGYTWGGLTNLNVEQTDAAETTRASISGIHNVNNVAGDTTPSPYSRTEYVSNLRFLPIFSG